MRRHRKKGKMNNLKEQLDTLDLFPDTLAATQEGTGQFTHFGDVVRKYGFHLHEVDIGDITFQGGQGESVHRWYRLTPSYSPGLVRYFLSQYGADADSVVLDPFSGRGTTAIECQKLGIPCIGTEINPLLSQVGRFSLDWSVAREDLFVGYLKQLQHALKKHAESSIEDVLTRFNTTIPIIHDVFRWWKKDVLRDLIIARELSRNGEYSEISHLLWLAINMSSIECANIHRNHPTITFDDDHTREISVYDELFLRLTHIQHDLVSLTDKQRKHSRLCGVHMHDALEVDSLWREKRLKKPSLVITSPPYPNRYSYIHQTRPQLHFMELLQDRGEATEIDLKTIGGTWGRATSNLMKEHIAPPKHLTGILDYVPELKEKSTLMCNYATKYFVDLDKHIESLRRIVGKEFRGAYVVGNSRLSDVEIFTECILARLFERHGFGVEQIVLFRKRGGRKRLYETAVCVTG
jgi:hypothetical protein